MSPKIIAHRGLSKEAPENTLSAVKAALALGIDYIEIDVRLTKDNVPIVIHDSTVSRTSGIKNGPSIHELTLKQIQGMDVGSFFGMEFANEPIPTLEEVLSLNWKTTGLMLEIKHCRQPNAVVVENVFKILRKQKLPKMVIGSFSLPIFKLIQQQLKNELKIQTIGIIEKTEKIRPFIETGAKHLALYHKILTPSLIKNLKKENVEIWTFTVNDLSTARSLVSLHVDGIISNYPRIFL